VSKTVNTTSVIKDIYALGHLVEQTDGAGTILASFTYDTNGTLTSVVLGNPNSGPRYDYVYDGQGNVVALTDSSGNVVASYSYDAFGALTSSSETFPNGWSNPFRYDGAQGVRYDAETGLYWMTVRAYDPALGRFLSHDPLGRLAALGLDTQPYVYAGNNPVNNTDPSGMLFISGPGGLVAIPNPPAARCGRECPNSSGGGGKYTITVHCAKLRKGDAYYDDPHCTAWRTWYSKAAALRTTDINNARQDAGTALIAAGIGGLVGSILAAQFNFLKSKWLNFAMNVLTAFSFLQYIFQGMEEKGWNIPHDVEVAVNSTAAILLGVARFIQALYNAGGWLVQTLASDAFSFTPEGGVMKLLGWVLGMIVGPLLVSISAGSYATYLALQDKYDHMKSQSVQAWCDEYGEGRCGSTPAESFDV
jgi:RHS repeat-associated protein